MRVEDVMETAVEAISGDTPADQAWSHMRHRGIEIFVIMDDTEISGLVTRQQLGGRHGDLKRRDRRLADFVPIGHVTTTPDGRLRHVAKLLEGRVAGCVPVLRDGHLVGVLTVGGLLHRLARSGHAEAPRPPRSRTHRAGRRPPAPADGGAESRA